MCGAPALNEWLYLKHRLLLTAIGKFTFCFYVKYFFYGFKLSPSDRHFFRLAKFILCFLFFLIIILIISCSFLLSIVCFETETEIHLQNKLNLFSNGPKSSRPNLHWVSRVTPTEEVSDRLCGETSSGTIFMRKPEWIKLRGISLKLCLIESWVFRSFYANCPMCR